MATREASAAATAIARNHGINGKTPMASQLAIDLTLLRSILFAGCGSAAAADAVAPKA